VSRWGRYKAFSVVGTALMTVGLYLLSLFGVHTSSWAAAVSMAVFGFGPGLILQVLTAAVQNAVLNWCLKSSIHEKYRLKGNFELGGRILACDHGGAYAETRTPEEAAGTH